MPHKLISNRINDATTASAHTLTIHIVMSQPLRRIHTLIGFAIQIMSDNPRQPDLSAKYEVRPGATGQDKRNNKKCVNKDESHTFFGPCHLME
ncbi:MAG TPA: hypothetical protein VF436_04955 [Dyella sp.]